MTVLTSSPFFPGGPGGPRAPTGPCREIKESNVAVQRSLANYINRMSLEYLHPVLALRAHQRVLGILEVPIHYREEKKHILYT